MVPRPVVGSARCRPEKAHIPIIATSADLRESDRAAMLEAGLTDCLGKPFSLAELSAVVSRFGRRGTP